MDNLLTEKLFMRWYSDNCIDIGNSIGVDEVGRGPIAGPVVSAAVWLSDAAVELLLQEKIRIDDSKKMSAKQRQKVVTWVMAQPPSVMDYSIGVATVEEIDAINILHAALLSMKRAHASLLHKSEKELRRNFDGKIVLVDGNRAPDLGSHISTKAVVKGDEKVLSIAVASIIAKEYRDSLMVKLSDEFPGYGWKTNVGYGTKPHLDAIRKMGITVHHRKSFSPVNNCYNGSFILLNPCIHLL
jgi:ribonuclease HII